MNWYIQSQKTMPLMEAVILIPKHMVMWLRKIHELLDTVGSFFTLRCAEQ